MVVKLEVVSVLALGSQMGVIVVAAVVFVVAARVHHGIEPQC